MIDLDCRPANFPCWDHYGVHQESFVSQWVITTAECVLRERMSVLDYSFEHLQRIRGLLDNYIDLISARWRNCVREPFNFEPHEDGISSIKGDLTSLLGLGKPVEVMRRL